MARIPSTQALRALDSFARHGTVWQAAEELNLTRSAVSHQLRLLERDLGFALTRREGTRISLTAQGAAYAGDIRRALTAISGSALRNGGRGASGPLLVSCTPGFAFSWLCPKIGRFRSACPDVSLNLVTPRRLDDLSNTDADLFISFIDGDVPNMNCELLKEVEFTPLCSPTYLNRLGAEVQPEQLPQAELLHLNDHSDWQAWRALAGLRAEQLDHGIVFSDIHLVYAAAMNSQGIAMGDEFVCQEAMQSGRLVRLFDLSIRTRRSYHLVTPPDKIGHPAIAAFRGWLLEELANGS
ncbi:MAG: LysR substrate-binding domain-containing protein [Paracoccaceae bacterium]